MKRDNEHTIFHSSSNYGVEEAKSKYRRVYHEPLATIPELNSLGYNDIREAISLAEHEHINAFEFVFIEKGKAAWEIEQKRYETWAGDIFHARPGEIHQGGYNVIEPCRLWWVIIQVPDHKNTNGWNVSKNGWLGLNTEEAGVILDRLWDLPRVQSVPISPVTNSLRRLRRVLDQPDPFSHIEGRISILDFLLHQLRPDDRKASLDEQIKEEIHLLIGHLNQSPEWRPSVPDLAERVGLSSSHFHRVFKEITGLTPIHYMERLRTDQACQRLSNSEDSITHIAFELGYSTSQHFATVFRRVTGKTPSEWRRLYSKQ